MLEILKLVVALLPVLEAAIPGKNQGDAKREALKVVLQAVNAAALEMWPVIEGVVAAIVAYKNASGEFKK